MQQVDLIYLIEMFQNRIISNYPDRMEIFSYLGIETLQTKNI